MERQIGKNRVLYKCDKCGKEYAVYHSKKIVYTGFSLFEGYKEKIHLEFCKECEKEFNQLLKLWLNEPKTEEEITDEEFQRILDRVSRRYEFEQRVKAFQKELENEAI